jgi:hypothetical protein
MGVRAALVRVTKGIFLVKFSDTLSIVVWALFGVTEDFLDNLFMANNNAKLLSLPTLREIESKVMGSGLSLSPKTMNELFSRCLGKVNAKGPLHTQVQVYRRI